MWATVMFYFKMGGGGGGGAGAVSCMAYDVGFRYPKVLG